MLKKRLSQMGFTLIELMVVVAIIGVLMAAGVVAFTNGQRSARDAKRRADVDAISKAFEQYYQNNSNVYPAVATAIDAVSYFPSGARPVDSKGVAYTVSGLTAAGATYCVCGQLEQLGKGNSGAACNFAAAAKDYVCAQALQ